MSKVLVLTNSNDGKHSDLVLEKIQAKGIEAFRFDSNRFANGTLSVDFTLKGTQQNFVMYDAKSKIYSEEIMSVWYRRPRTFLSPIKDEVQRKYAENELLAFLEGLWLTIPNARWMNSPVHLESARKKVFQLRVASDIGLLTPKTLITNNPESAKVFVQESNQGVVFKALDREGVFVNGVQMVIPTTLLTKHHLDKLMLVQKTPCLFQEFIDKSHELRVTVVGKNIFSVEVYPPKDFPHGVDWRDSYRDPDAHRRIKIPPYLQEKVILLMQRLGLVYGALDFLVDKEGNFWFLEINPNGQWLWVEKYTGLPISDAITNFLCDFS